MMTYMSTTNHVLLSSRWHPSSHIRQNRLLDLVNFSSANAQVSITDPLSALVTYAIPIYLQIFFICPLLVRPLNGHITDTLNILTEVVKAVLNMVQVSVVISSIVLEHALHGMVLISNHHQTMQLMCPRNSINIPVPIDAIWNTWRKTVSVRIVDQDVSLIPGSKIRPYCFFLLSGVSVYCAELNSN